MKNIIIITGHGHYASGMISSFEMIYGKDKDVYAVDFVDNDTSSDMENRYKEIINKNESSSFLFLCDLLGGTPFKEASKLAFTKPNIKVVSGCNIGSLLQIMPSKDKFNINELADQIIKYSVQNIICFDEKKKFKESKESNDGI